MWHIVWSRLISWWRNAVNVLFLKMNLLEVGSCYSISVSFSFSVSSVFFLKFVGVFGSKYVTWKIKLVSQNSTRQIQRNDMPFIDVSVKFSSVPISRWLYLAKWERFTQARGITNHSKPGRLHSQSNFGGFPDRVAQLVIWTPGTELI